MYLFVKTYISKSVPDLNAPRHNILCLLPIPETQAFNSQSFASINLNNSKNFFVATIQTETLPVPPVSKLRVTNVLLCGLIALKQTSTRFEFQNVESSVKQLVNSLWLKYRTSD